MLREKNEQQTASCAYFVVAFLPHFMCMLAEAPSADEGGQDSIGPDRWNRP